MKIEIVCPTCGKVLTDKFECESARFAVGYAVIEMECCECEKYLTIEIKMSVIKGD